MPTPPDHEFVALQEAYRAGDQNAATTLHNRFAPAVRAFLSKLLDTRAPDLRLLHDSEEMKQDVFVSFFQNLLRRLTFDHPEQLASFLHHIAHSRFIDSLRHHQRQRYRFLLHRLRLDDPSLDDHPSLICRNSSPSERAETEDYLQQLLMDLPYPMSSVVTLKVRGFTTVEIASQLRISERYVRRILQGLREGA